jgi:hypothetical protein
VSTFGQVFAPTGCLPLGSADRFPASATPGSTCVWFSARHCALSQEAQQPVGDRQPSTRVAQLLIEVSLELAFTPYFAATQRHLRHPRLHATGLVQLSHSRRTVSCTGRCGRTALGSNVTAMFSPSPTPAAHFGIRRGALLLALLFTRALAAEFDVRAHGATGDGQTLDTAAIHRAIAAASAAGGGTVRSPAGTLLSFSIRLKNNLTRHLDPGATLLAAPPPIFLAIFHGDRGVSAQAVYLYLALKRPPYLPSYTSGATAATITASTPALRRTRLSPPAPQTG